MKAFLKRLGDMFLDQNNGLDDKRVLGVPTFTLGVIFAVLTGAIVLGTGKTELVAPGLGVAGFLCTTGGTLLGIALKGDRDLISNGMKGQPAPSDPAADNAGR